MPGYAVLRANVSALVAQADVESGIDPAAEYGRRPRPRGRGRLAAALVDRSGLQRVTRRRENVKLLAGKARTKVEGGQDRAGRIFRAAVSVSGLRAPAPTGRFAARSVTLNGAVDFGANVLDPDRHAADLRPSRVRHIENDLRHPH